MIDFKLKDNSARRVYNIKNMTDWELNQKLFNWKKSWIFKLKTFGNNTYKIILLVLVFKPKVCVYLNFRQIF